MTYKILKGVNPPAGRVRPGSYYDDLVKAIGELEVNDPCAVKIVFDDNAGCTRAMSKIYGINTKLARVANYRYTVQHIKNENSIYVRKISDEPIISKRKANNGRTD